MKNPVRIIGICLMALSFPVAISFFIFNPSTKYGGFLILIVLFIIGYLIFKLEGDKKQLPKSSNEEKSPVRPEENNYNKPMLSSERSHEETILKSNKLDQEETQPPATSSPAAFPKHETQRTSSHEQANYIIKEENTVQVFPVNFKNKHLVAAPENIKKELQEGFEAKFIDMKYNPLGSWVQTEKKKVFPYVNMPAAKSRVLLPSPGKLKSAGVSESGFKKRLISTFGNKILSQHFLIFEGAANNYEPDFIFQLLDHGLLIDIEIDEPYSGKTRKPMHYLNNSDIDRDHYFNKNGWVIIRFAEKQIIETPYACIFHISQLIDNLLGTSYSSQIRTEEVLEIIPRWTYEDALKMAEKFYREQYLGIEFTIREEIAEKLETEIQLVKENRSPYGLIDITYRDTPIANLDEEQKQLIDVLESNINQGKYLVLQYADSITHLVKPLKIDQTRSIHKLAAYDYLKNRELELETRLITIVTILDSPFFSEVNRQNGISKTFESVETAINNMLYIRLEYTNASYENSLRTIGPLDYTEEFNIFGYNRQHIAGFCHLREELRSFRIDRIQRIWILNLGFD